MSTSMYEDIHMYLSSVNMCTNPGITIFNGYIIFYSNRLIKIILLIDSFFNPLSYQRIFTDILLFATMNSLTSFFS